jgi:hypothetical protein
LHGALAGGRSRSDPEAVSLNQRSQLAVFSASIWSARFCSLVETRA